MAKTLRKQAGFTLFEMVVTLALVAMMMGILGLCLYQPIQGMFWLHDRQSIFKPILLGVEQVGFGLTQPVDEVHLVAEGIKLQRAGDERAFLCQGNQLITVENKTSKSLLLDNVKCSFEVKPLPQAWVISLRVESMKRSDMNLNRVYWLRRGP